MSDCVICLLFPDSPRKAVLMAPECIPAEDAATALPQLTKESQPMQFGNNLSSLSASSAMTSTLLIYEFSAPRQAPFCFLSVRSEWHSATLQWNESTTVTAEPVLLRQEVNFREHSTCCPLPKMLSPMLCATTESRDGLHLMKPSYSGG